MTTRTLSVVIPAYNAAGSIGATMEALGAALDRAPSFDADVVLVDDGSADETAATAAAAAEGRLALRVISQPNRGRFEARRTGLDAATGDWVLLLDSRVTMEPNALRYVAERLDSGESVWNGHVRMAVDGNLLGTFWNLLAELAWPDYFERPRTTSFGHEEFDRFPKGTTCFLAPTALLRDGVAAFQSRYADLRLANDDTPLLRWVAEHDRIHISPAFACEYEPRASIGAFIRHSVHRGMVFLDGHGRRESRFFPAVVGFYPVSAIVALLALRHPRIVPVTVVGVSAAAAALGVVRQRSAFEIASLGTVTPFYALGHGIGMWKGLAHVVRRRRAP